MNGYHFLNWAQTYECYPQKFFEPNNLDELRSILRTARADGKKIRLVGFGHSPSDLCCTDDFLVSTKKFNRILSIDEEKRIVSAEPGVLLGDLVQFLKSHQLALSVLPAVGTQTIGGPMSTCTHGSGAQYPVMADLLVSLSLLTADDQVISCSRHENADIFHAVCGGLGTLGVIVKLDFQCEPYYNLRQLRYPMTFDDFVEAVGELCQESDHLKANYFPYADHVIVSSVNRSSAKPTKRQRGFLGRFSDWFWDVFILVYVFEFFYFLSLYAPFMVKYVNRVAYALFSDTDYCVDGYEKVAFFNCLFHQYVSEWSIDRSRCGEALRRLKSMIESKRIPAHFPIEIRFVRRDSFWLSPAYERDVCCINIIAYCPYEKKPEHEEYWTAFSEIMKSLGGRPHLAKDHDMTAEDMRKAYPRFDDFLELRKRLDPKNIFVNDYIRRVFGIE